MKVKLNLPPLQSEQTHLFIKNLKQISQKELIGLSYATDAAHLVNPVKPLPFVIFGPGNPDVAHKVNEFVPINQIFEVIEYLTKALIKTYMHQ